MKNTSKCSTFKLNMLQKNDAHSEKSAFRLEYAAWPDNFAWSGMGAIEGMDCVQIYEPNDPHTWDDNYLCWTKGKITGIQWHSVISKFCQEDKSVVQAISHTWYYSLKNETISFQNCLKQF